MKNDYFETMSPSEEILFSLRHWRSWYHLGMNDIRSKYRRTYLGPLWLVLGMGVSLAMMAVLWSNIFGQDWREYLTYMLSGIITWYWVQAYVTQSCDVYAIEYSGLVRSLPTPPIIFAFRFVLKGALLYVHYLPIWLISAVITGVYPTLLSFAVLPIGAFIIMLNGLSFAIILGFSNARLRDIGPSVLAIMTPMMLMTPILWRPDMLGEYAWLADLNPFTHFVAIIREPLLGDLPSVTTWGWVLGLTSVNTLVALLVYKRYRKYLVFWI